MLTSKQRAFLRKRANALTAIFLVGKGGTSDNMNTQISAALEAHELVKLKTLENCSVSADSAAAETAAATSSEVVETRGNSFVLYKESVKHKKISLELKEI